MIKLNSALENKLKERITYLRFFFYIFILTSYSHISSKQISEWGSFLNETTFLNEFFFHYEVILVFKTIFYTSCFLCAFSFKNKLFSSFAAVFGLFYWTILYQTGYDRNVFQLPAHVLVIFSIYENSKHLTEDDFIVLVKICFAFAFFQAGFTKIRRLGLSWINEDIPRDYLMFLKIAYTNSSFSLKKNLVNLILIRNYDYFKYFIYSVPFFEAIAPLFLFRKLRFFFLYFLILQIGIYYSMFISFEIFLGVYSFFIVPEVFNYINILHKNRHT